jgi:hypothetical protein
MNRKQKTEAASRGHAQNNAAAAVFAGADENCHGVIEHIYYEWDAALSRSDVKGLLALYASDAVLESACAAHAWQRNRDLSWAR